MGHHSACHRYWGADHTCLVDCRCTTWGLLSCAAALAPVVPWLAMLFGQALHLLNLAQSSTACQAVASACRNQRASNEAAPVEDSGALTCASDAVQHAHDVQGAHDQPVGWPAPSCSPLTSTAQKGHHAPTAAAEGSTRWEAAWQLCLLHSCCLTYSLFAAASWLRAAGKLKVVWHWHDGTVALAMAALPAVQVNCIEPAVHAGSAAEMEPADIEVSLAAESQRQDHGFQSNIL